jgi:anti-sigma regulatory factor (Ser/Thr protein kinase)
VDSHCREGQSEPPCPEFSDQAAYDGQPASIAAARSFLDAFLTHVNQIRTVAPRQWEAARLVTSELVTNAVRHAPGPCTVALAVRDTGLTVAVTDTSPRPPVPQRHDPVRIGSHGMEIVAALCLSVTTAPAPGGKTVRVELSIA